MQTSISSDINQQLILARLAEERSADCDSYSTLDKVMPIALSRYLLNTDCKVDRPSARQSFLKSATYECNVIATNRKSATVPVYEITVLQICPQSKNAVSTLPALDKRKYGTMLYNIYSSFCLGRAV